VGILEQVKEITPDTIRIVLSSYAPATTIINAINRGEVYRFVTKPWDDQELKLIVKEALERYNLIRERRDLLDTIAERNRVLQKLNERLAQLYDERTQDLAYSQRILAELPVPVIGIDPEGVIVFTNRATQQLFEEEGCSLLELSAAEGLPDELVGAIHNSSASNTMVDFSINTRRFQVQCQSVEGQHGLRGNLLIFHELFQIGGENQ
jgi:PAS domain-containing protein